MGNGQVAEQRDKECALCESDISSTSYFLRVDKDLLEVCPECHHFFTYGTEEQLENYKRRMNIKL